MTTSVKIPSRPRALTSAIEKRQDLIARENVLVREAGRVRGENQSAYLAASDKLRDLQPELAAASVEVMRLEEAHAEAAWEALREAPDYRTELRAAIAQWGARLEGPARLVVLHHAAQAAGVKGAQSRALRAGVVIEELRELRIYARQCQAEDALPEVVRDALTCGAL